ncbi:MAG: hypothetical protein HY286_09085 [Planctomycetes bacterium]|nr:hypothetical protein [Planctomycetota bacterium]
MKKFTSIFTIFCCLATGGYSWSEYIGWETTPTHHERIDPSVRRSPGGFRSYTFWHQGTHIGK